jgi:hypothetical protein
MLEKSRLELIEDFLQLCNDMFWQLRSQNAMREADFESLLGMMDALAVAYRERVEVPKQLAAVLFDLSTALYSSSTEYAGHFDRFCDRARDILN